MSQPIRIYKVQKQLRSTTCTRVSFASKMTEVEIEEISDFLAKEEAPLLFLYSSSDTLIKPAAVEEYIKTCTRNMLSFHICTSSIQEFDAICLCMSMCHIVCYFTPGRL